jgi:hypothetical protein
VVRVDLPLENIKVWRADDDSAEYVAMVFRADNQTHMRVLRVSPDGSVDTQEILPTAGGRGHRYNLYLLANTEGCFLQVRHTVDDQVERLQFDLTPQGIVRQEDPPSP